MSDSRCIFTGNQKAKCCNVSSWIRSKIKDEGVQARNIIKYSVPVDNPSPSKRQTRKCDYNLSSSEIAPKVMDDDDDTVNDRMTSTSIVSASHKEGGSRRSSFSSIIDVPDIINKRSSLYTNKFHSEHSKSDTHSGSLISNTNSKSVCPQSRHCRRLTSATTTPPPPTTTALFRKPLTESEYKARYWGQMLDTLRRTIDEIYSACETDENEVECKEVIMILEHSKQDFFSLIEKMNLLRDYEQADEQNKPNSLAWDERTTLPGKPIMCQVLASTAAFASVKKQSYLSIPLVFSNNNSNNKSDSSVIEIVDSDSNSEFDANRSGSNSCISDRRSKVFNAKKNHNTTNSNNSNKNNSPNEEEDEEEEPSSLSQPSLIPSLSNAYESCKRIGSKRIHCNPECQNTTTSYNSSRDKFKLCPTSLDNEPPRCQDGDGDGDEDEVDASYTGLSMCRTTEDDAIDIEHDHHQGEDMTRYAYLVDDDDDEEDNEYADQEDNTLSRDLEKLDKAIEHVTTAERVLSHQLDRAQLAEAALRRRLIEEEEEKAAFVVQSTGYNQSWYLHRHRLKNGGNNNNNSNNNNNNSFIKLTHNKNHLKSGDIHRPSDNTTDEFGIDTDADVVDIDSVTLDDDDEEEDVDESEKLIVNNTNTKDKQIKEKAPTSVTNQPLNSTTTTTTTITTDDDPIQPGSNIDLIKKTTDINADTEKKQHSCCNCQCHNHNNRDISNNATSENKTVEQVQKKSTSENCYISKPNSQSQYFTNNNAISTAHKSDISSTEKELNQSEINGDEYAYQKIYQSEGYSSEQSNFVDSLPEMKRQHDVSDANIQPENDTFIKCLLELRESGKSVDRRSPHIRGSNDESVSVSASSAHYALPTVASDGSICQQGVLLIPKTEVKSRTPGHGVHMHEKLSARSKKRTANSIEEIEEKQDRARVLRQRHLLERTERVHELSKKVDEVHLQKRLLLHQRRSCLERRLHAAERKRQAELTRRVLKAHDEQTKLKEIAFIQTLEAEQKQYSILTKHEESRARLNELAIERQKRTEEKQGREEAAKVRRRALEASRRARMDALQARWETRAQQLASRAELMEHSRRAAARAKEQYREIRMANLEEQQRVHIEQLRSKIQRKQAESERRHQESLREISRKAFEMSVLTHTGDDSLTVPGIEPYPIQKWCKACQVMIVSEVSLKSHLHGKRHQNAIMEAAQNRPVGRSELEAFNLSHLVDAPTEMSHPYNDIQQERLKLRRKRTRKLRQKMNQRGLLFLKEIEQMKIPLPDSPNKPQLVKLIKDARRFLNLPDSGPWVITRVQAMEKSLNALLRYLCNTQSKANPNFSNKNEQREPSMSDNSSDRQVCILSGLLSVLTSLIGLIREQKPSSTQLVPEKTYKIACRLLQALCYSNTDGYIRMLLTNDVSILVDCLVVRFSVCIPSNRHFNSYNISSTPEVNTATPTDQSDHHDSSYFHCYSGNSCTLDLLNFLTNLLNGLCELNLSSTTSYSSLSNMDNTSSSTTIRDSTLTTPTASPAPDETRSTTPSTTTPNSSVHSLYNSSSIIHESGKHFKADCQRVQDFLSYIVSSGLVDLLSTRLSNPKQASWLLVNNNNNNNSSNSGRPGSASNQFVEHCQHFVLSSIAFLTSLTRLLTIVSGEQLKHNQHHPYNNQTDGCYPLSLVSSESIDSVVLQSSVEESNSQAKTSSSGNNNNTTRRCPSSTSSCDTTSVNNCKIMSNSQSNNPQSVNDPTKLLETVNTTEVFGLVPLLYCLLLDPNSRPIDAAGSMTNDTHNSLPPSSSSTKQSNKTKQLRHNSQKDVESLGSTKLTSFGVNTPHESSSPPFRSEVIAEITLNILKLINSLSSLHQHTMQSILGGELICLLMRHILVNLLTRCVSSQVNTTAITNSSTPSMILPRSPISIPLPAPPPPRSAAPQQQPQHQKSKEPSSSNLNHNSKLSTRKLKKEEMNPRIDSNKNDDGEAEDDDDCTADLLPSGARKVVVKKNLKLKSVNDDDDDNRSQTVTSSSSEKSKWTTNSNSSTFNSVIVNSNKQCKEYTSYSITENILHEAILCIGYLCALNIENQTNLQCGPSPNLLQHLLSLPFEYFSHHPLTDILYPTLIACCYQHAQNTSILETELSPTILANYIEESLLEKKMDSLTKVNNGKSNSGQCLDKRYNFERRFSILEWNSAKAYFTR